MKLSLFALAMISFASQSNAATQITACTLAQDGAVVRIAGQDYQVLAVNADTGEIINVNDVATESEIVESLTAPEAAMSPAKTLGGPGGGGYGYYYRSAFRVGLSTGTESRSYALQGSTRRNPIFGARNTSYYTNLHISKTIGEYGDAGAILGVSSDFGNNPFKAAITDYNVGGFLIIGFPVGYGADGTENVLGLGLEAGAKIHRKNFLNECPKKIQGFFYPTISYEINRGDGYTFTKTFSISPGMTIDGIQQQFMALKLSVRFTLNQ